MTIRVERDNRGKTAYSPPPEKPSQLEIDCFWATVERVIQSDGFGPHEQTWACEIMGAAYPSDAAREAAEGWYDDTDQCGDCEVVIRIERFDGAVSLHRFRMAPTIKVTTLPLHESGGGA